MIRSFRSQALEHLYNGKPKLIEPRLRRKCENILLVLSAANDVQALNLPGFRLHPLKGKLTGRWAVTVRGNWRITFRFDGGNAYDVDFEDYHGK